MGLVHVDLFTTLDGVAQAPGGPDEDLSGGFPYGGWQATAGDADVGREVRAGIAATDALLLGRRTYDIFAAYWPTRGERDAPEIARRFNAVPKYVASRGRPVLAWRGSSQLGPDLAAEVRAVRDRHEIVRVIGSVDLVQTLLAEDLYDVLTLWVHPVVLGQGKKVFPDGAVPARLRPVEPAFTTTSGVVRLRYAPTGAAPTTGEASRSGD